MPVLSTALGEFLIFASVALMILVNMGQLTQNMVARNIYIARMDLRAVASGRVSRDGFGSDTFASPASSGAPLQQHDGVRPQYYWGLYSVCGGEGTTGARSCAHRSFGHEYDPLNTIVADTTNVTAVNFDWARSAPGKLANTHWLHTYSRVGFYFLFVGTIMTGVTFLAGLASESGLYLLSSGMALLTGAVLAVGAGMWTAVVSEARKTTRSGVGRGAGIGIHFGQSLWMTWAATGAALAATIPFLIAFFQARRERKIYNDRTYADQEDYQQMDSPKREEVTPTDQAPATQQQW